MPEDDVLYSDINIIKGIVNANKITCSSDETTYSEVKILKTQPPTELPGRQQPAVSNGCSRVKWRVALLVLGILLAAAVTALCVTFSQNIQTQIDLEKLRNVVKNLTERCNETKPINVVQPTSCTNPPSTKTNEPCKVCDAGWEQHSDRCYLFSTTLLNWNESRGKCKGLGADLVIIHSREEQIFLEKKLRIKMSTAGDTFWIGLTDSEVEGKWLWVDGSPLVKSVAFWLGNEPDNWKGEDPDGEDCVRIGENNGASDLKCWLDRSCKVSHKSICEKKVNTGHCINMCVKSSYT